MQYFTSYDAVSYASMLLHSFQCVKMSGTSEGWHTGILGPNVTARENFKLNLMTSCETF